LDTYKLQTNINNIYSALTSNRCSAAQPQLQFYATQSQVFRNTSGLIPRNLPTSGRL